MDETPAQDPDPEKLPGVPALIVVYDRHEPDRLGECFLLSLGDWTMGRGPGPHAGPRRASAVHQRPGDNQPREAIRNPKISRNQLQLHVDRLGDIRVNSIGRNRTLLNGWDVEKTHVQANDILALGRQLVLWCTLRPPILPDGPASTEHAFGRPDAHGVVGESPAIWAWRQARAAGEQPPLPPLAERREDIPLLLNQLLDQREKAEGFRRPDGSYRVSPELVCALLQHDFADETDLGPHVDRLLEESLSTTELAETPTYRFFPPEASPDVDATDPSTLSRGMINEAMERHGGLRERVWRDLGLTNRSQLDRLLKKHGIH